MEQGSKMSYEKQVQIIEKRFHELKNEQQKIKGNLVLSVLKPLFKNMADTDFETVFGLYVAQFHLNEQQKMIVLQQLKYIHVGIYDHVRKIKRHPLLGLFCLQQHYTLWKSKLTLTNIPQLTQEPIFQIFNKKLTEIIPYQITFFDSLYRKDDKQNTKIPEKLTQQTLEQPYYCYDFKIYENLLENYDGPLMNKLVRFLYYVIDFRWIQASELLKKQIITDQNLTECTYLIPVFENLKIIQEQIREQNTLKLIFQKRKTLQITKNENLSSQILKKVNELKNMYDFVCYYCQKIWQQFQNPYLKAVCYFFGKKFEVNCKFQQICENLNLGVMIKFLFTRRFLPPQYFNAFYEKFIFQAKTNPKLEHIMFVKSKSDVIQILSNYWDNHPNQLQKVALTCGIVIHKLGKGFNQQFGFLEKMVKIYQQFLRNIKSKEIQKEYMLKIMTVRSSKQPIEQDLIVKPQFKLYCEHRNDDCVFLTMLQKFLMNRGQQKWSKLKSKSNIANEGGKKHYEVQTINCPYCNYPTPRCSICLEHIKIFTVKSFINQQIKRKMQNKQKPYMKLTQPLEQALIWCPSCGHGGHFGHLQQWFKQNKACPVDRCHCKCKY